MIKILWFLEFEKGKPWLLSDLISGRFEAETGSTF